MNCVVPRENLKVLRKSIHTLSKIGAELYLEAHKDKLTLTTLNPDSTESGSFNFLSTFFSSYVVDLSSVPDVDGDSKKSLTFKVHMKIILPLFKRSLESQLDFLKFEYENSKDPILIKMKYRKDGIMMIHELKLMNDDSISISNDLNLGFSTFTSCWDCYNRLLLMFKSSDNEITLNVSPTKVIARNYCPGEPSRSHTVRSHMTFNPTDFGAFHVTEEASVNFSLKPLINLIHFAENFKLDIEFIFKCGGKPLTLKVKNPTFEVVFVVATVDENSDGNSSVVSRSSPLNSNKVHNNNRASDKVKKKTLFLDGNDNNSDSSLRDSFINNISEKKDTCLTDLGRIVFSRAFEPPYDHEAYIKTLGPVLAPLSDSE